MTGIQHTFEACGVVALSPRRGTKEEVPSGLNSKACIRLFDSHLPTPLPMDTRSKRRQSQSQRPSYPQVVHQSAPTSPSASVYQSTSSLSSISSINTTLAQNSSNMLQTQQAGFTSAPLPSPSSGQPTGYFGSMTQQHPPTSHPSQQQQRISQNQTAAGTYLGQRGGGGAPETAPFLKDFNLVAEAAKRAQMACLTRDLGDIGL